MPLADALDANLRLAERIRTARGTDLGRRFAAVQEWQHRRLQATYADLRALPRFQPACDFFLEELYGGKDFMPRNRELAGALPIMRRTMPARLLRTVAEALEVQALSIEFDLALAAALPGAVVNEANYAAAWRAMDREADRHRQLEMIVDVGHALDAVVHKNWVYHLLRLLRAPAHAAGFGELQHFLESGFAAFRKLEGAGDFLAVIFERETTIRQRIERRDPKPFNPTWPAMAEE